MSTGTSPRFAPRFDRAALRLKLEPLREVVRRLAPRGSPRGDLLRNLIAVARGVRETSFALLAARAPFDDIHDPAAWARLLSVQRCPAPPADAERDAAGAAGLVLQLYLSRAPRFARGLSGGPEGELARWILGDAGLALGGRAADNVRAAFADPPGARVQTLYDGTIEHRRRHPLALMARGRITYLRWLLDPARRRHLGLEAHHVMWFALSSAEDETAGVVPTYVRNPDWQRAIPEGLGSGYPRLRAWAAAAHGVGDLPLALDDYRRAHDLSALWSEPWQTFTAGRGVDPGDPIRGINVIGYQRLRTGLGQATRHTAAAVSLAGYEIAQRDFMVSDPSDLDNRLDPECFPLTIAHSPADSIDTCWDQSGLWRRPGVYRVAVWYWELEQGDPSWPERAAWVDEIWCPTRFVASVMERLMPQPIVPMLPGIELPRVTPLPRARFGLPDDHYLFLFMFDMGSVMERKNPLALIRAYREAFRPGERASLVIKVLRPSLDLLAEAALRKAAAAAGGGVILIDEAMTRADSFALMDACDAYVSLHRSEGYGLTLAEAMALGKPCIATGFSGNLDFMSPETSRLVGYRRCEVQHDRGPYRRGMTWADPDVGEAAHWMRAFYEDRDQARELGAAARRAVTEIASLEAYGARIRARIGEIERMSRP